MRRIASIAASIGLIVATTCQGSISGDSPSVKARIIGTSMRSLAKAYLSVCDIETLKEDNAIRISSLSDDEFRFAYRRVLYVLDDLPEAAQEKHGLNGHLSRDEFITRIESLDKKEMIAISESVPDSVIVSQLKGYLARRRNDPGKGDIAAQVKMFWRRVVYIIEGRY